MASKKAGVAGLAGRYATALFDLADEQTQLDLVERDVMSMRAMLDASPEFHRFIASPVMGREDQGKGVAALAAAAGACELFTKFLGELAHNRRLFALPHVMTAFLGRLADRRGESVAEVVSARPLSEAQKSAIISALAASVGGAVKIDVRIDPALLGGLVVKVGSRMVDGSISAKLQRLQLSMKGVG